MTMARHHRYEAPREVTGTREVGEPGGALRGRARGWLALADLLALRCLVEQSDAYIPAGP